MQMYEIPILLHGPLSDTPNFKVGQTVDVGELQGWRWVNRFNRDEQEEEGGGYVFYPWWDKPPVPGRNI